MKKLILTLLILSGVSLNLSLSASTEDENAPAKLITLVYSDNFKELCNNWVSGYSMVDNDYKITMLSESEYKEEKNFENTALFVLSTQKISESGEKYQWKIIAGRKVVVPIISKNNPFMDIIRNNGIAPSIFSSLTENDLSWGKLLRRNLDSPINFYITKADFTDQKISSFFDNSIPYKIVENTADLLKAINSDPLAIGFSLLPEIVNGKGFVENIVLLPFDKNESGHLEQFEDIYSDPDHFLRGVWIGKYPRELTLNIYLACDKLPETSNNKEFIKWVLTGGQDLLAAQGYSHLTTTERNSRLEILNNDTKLASSEKEISLFLWIALVGLSVFAGLIIIYTFKKGSRFVEKKYHQSQLSVLHESTVLAPKGLLFDKTHTWVYMEKDGLVRVGLDDFLHRITGALSRISVKQLGESVIKGEKIFTLIQDGKQLNILSPVSGIIRKTNINLAENASLINISPYDEGWVYMIEPANWSRESSLLFMSDRYSGWIKNELIRAKDFFTASLSSRKNEYAHLILQDGGELCENVLKEFGPEVWEDFQTSFINSSL